MSTSFLEVDDTDYTTVQVNGKDVHLGSLSAADLYDYFDEVDKTPKGTPERRFAGIKLVNKSLVSGTPETGTTNPQRVGTDETLAALKKKNPKTIGKLVEAALTLNGMNSADAQKQAKEEAKND